MFRSIISYTHIASYQSYHICVQINHIILTSHHINHIICQVIYHISNCLLYRIISYHVSSHIISYLYLCHIYRGQLHFHKCIFADRQQCALLHCFCKQTTQGRIQDFSKVGDFCKGGGGGDHSLSDQQNM